MGAPDAVQVAHRWHIWRNLGEAVERTVARHRASLAAAIADPEPRDRPAITEVARNTPRTGRAPPTAGSHRGAHPPALERGPCAAGPGRDHSRDQPRQPGLARGTARRFARAESADELLVNNRTGYRVSVLDAYKPDLHRRWNEGCTNATQLFEEIKSRGYQGSEKMVRTYLQPFRALAHIPAPPRKPPAVRRVVSWIMTNPDTIAAEHRAGLESILVVSPELATLTGHVRAFAKIMGARRGRDLERWMAAVDADDQPALHSFVRGLRRDQDAVVAGLTMSLSARFEPVPRLRSFSHWFLSCAVRSRSPDPDRLAVPNRPGYGQRCFPPSRRLPGRTALRSYQAAATAQREGLSPPSIPGASRRTKAALNALAITFEGRLSAGRK
ncbi:hypothetical protein ABZW96_27615 [Nocardia sp. NPDC004168]|uniref:hypothetical protein n=1 Tax=Nocardia sp. NPDC004168 TaxID=3154452 RepID=UPI0033A795E9